jgi:hypothetical protein
VGNEKLATTRRLAGKRISTTDKSLVC